MTNHDISWHFVIKFKNIIFVAKTPSYGIFVVKIYDYTLIDSFWGSAGFLDSPTSYATLAAHKTICILPWNVGHTNYILGNFIINPGKSKDVKTPLL